MPAAFPNEVIAELMARNEVLMRENRELAAVHDQAAGQQAEMLAMMEALDGMIWSVDKELRFRTMNEHVRKRMLKTHGTAPKVGDKVMEIMKGLDEAAAKAWEGRYTKALGGEKLSFLYELTLPDDSTHLEYSFSPIMAGDTVVGVSCFAHDVTERINTVRVLEASEKRFRALTENSHDMLTIRDAQGAVLYESPAKRRILGYEPEDEDVPEGFDLIDTEDLPATHAAFDHALATPGVPIHHRRRMVHKDGSIVHTIGYTTNLLDMPEVAGVVSNIRNITELVEAHEHIRTSEALMAEAQRAGNLGSWQYALEGTDEPRIGPARWSYEMFRILGHVANGIIPSFTNFLEAIHPDDRDLVEATIREGSRTRTPRSLEHRIVRPDGTIRWLHQETIVVNDNSGPDQWRIVGTMQDITERKIAQDQVRASEERYRAMIEGSTDGISLSDADSKILYISPSVERILGYTQEEMNGSLGADLVYEHHLHGFRHFFQDVVSKPGSSSRMQLKLRRKDGAIRWVDALLTNMLHVPAVGAVVTNYHDITEAVAMHEKVEFERANLNALINSTQDMVWSVDSDYRIIAVNKAAVDIFEPAIGFRIRPGDSLRVPDVSGSSPTEDWYAHFQRALAGETFKLEEYSAPPHDTYTEVNYSPIRDMAAVVGVAVFARDITQTRRVQKELQQWNTQLEDRVVERTQELLLVNEELEEETEKNKRLGREVELRNKDLMASIAYASNIQRSLIPGAEEFSFFRAMGLMFRPRDVVSGDFLWCRSTKDELVMVVADCTGHGVPGAMMSMMGHDLLNHIVLQHAHNDPAGILQQLDASITRLFQRNEGSSAVNDGMDAAVVVLDKATMQLSFSGAVLPILVVRDGEATLLPGSKATIGGHTLRVEKEFVPHPFSLMPGDRLCMFTDGYGDQFGGANNKKFYRKRFFELLVRLSDPSGLHPLNATQAAAALDEHFTTWVGTNEQVDDVLVLLLDV